MKHFFRYWNPSAKVSLEAYKMEQVLSSAVREREFDARKIGIFCRVRQEYSISE